MSLFFSNLLKDAVWAGTNTGSRVLGGNFLELVKARQGQTREKKGRRIILLML